MIMATIDYMILQIWLKTCCTVCKLCWILFCLASVLSHKSTPNRGNRKDHTLHDCRAVPNQNLSKKLSHLSNFSIIYYHFHWQEPKLYEWMFPPFHKKSWEQNWWLHSPFTAPLLIISYKLVTCLVDCIIRQVHKNVVLQERKNNSWFKLPMDVRLIVHNFDNTFRENKLILLFLPQTTV